MKAKEFFSLFGTFSVKYVLLVNGVGFFPEEEGRCITVEISISLSENQGINLVGESRKASWIAPAHTKPNTCTQRGQEGRQSPWTHYLQGLNLVVIDR